ncbi:ribosomal protection-like ABC-F family protein [Lactobacillus helveticus]|uniref:ribosomal protection-like ABC-F family protein n=1 Tax=Lactobacillus helveticus TaxID=1587 RepID=UPI000CD8AEC1|nr:ATP-binding cassette domain-containing protein [Lactobacillus helveticus]MBO1882757.1 ABC-F family ATP-binding cassette domain-containing protein [Lactobacillus helveticus]POO20034.1 Nucleotide-binding protein ExpZ [Lactobacillus helveticus]QYH34204.1 ABC-F family ATP-binding cassette domain-containing protein [Lactobacillus helveticus]GFP09801.1 ABC-F type ribosomal protection protein [Lactobacillus helveticus]GIP67698.1 ABC-F type ribosomal protection protein [Lactobacillus helveticus]
MSNIKIVNLSFRYNDSSENIFNNLNLNLDSFWKLGLVGRNGRGKTTFLNLLRGKLYGSGKIQTKIPFSYYPITINEPKNITFYELQKQKNFDQWKLERELNLMNVGIDLLWQPFNTLSGGERTKVLLALSFTDRDSFALIDEPTNHLDEISRKEVANYLVKQTKGYIVVSHDRDFLNQVTDHILAIENTEIHLYQGDFYTYEDTKQKRDEFNQLKNKKLQGEIKNLNRKYVRFNNWSDSIEAQKYSGMKTKHIINRRTQLNKGAIGHDAAKMMKKAINTRRRLDRKIDSKRGLMANIEDVPELTINFKPNYHQTLLETQHFSLTVGNKCLFDNLNLIIRNHGVISLEGKNGSGKSKFLKLLLGQAVDSSYQGKYKLTNGLSISYLPQNFNQYTGTLKEFAKKQKIPYERLLNLLKKMGFPRSSFNTPIEKMSMGQQKRVAITKSLVEPADLYLWDEPANYLDIFNQDQIIKLLQKIKPAMLLIEHDQHFIKQVANQRIKLNQKI